MAVDSPARIAVLGAGPIGLEAALYGRFLGYDVDLYERGRAVEHLQRWGHVQLFTPWRMNVSSLGIAALSAQDPDWRPAEDEALMTGRDLAARYFGPLAQSDLLIDGLHEQTEVLAVGRGGPLKGDLVGDESRGDGMFRILLRDASGKERTAEADVVFDTTGTYGQHNWLGQGGIPAVGEGAAAEWVDYGLPDILGCDRASYAGRRVLLIGSGHSAATNLVALEQLAAMEPGTHVTWITRGEAAVSEGPIRLMADDPLPQRDQLARQANTLATTAESCATHWPGTEVDAIELAEQGRGVSVRLLGQHAGTIEVDRIIANVGYRPDSSLYSELQVHECFATGRPMTQQGDGSQRMINPEPNFYVLGAKSYGRDSRFLLSDGRDQIRDVFSIVGDRADLDLYSSMAKRNAALK
jgi:thioredoxin reductase